MRTTLNIAGDLLEEAQRVTGLATRTAVIEAGLRALIEQRRRLGRRRTAGFGAPGRRAASDVGSAIAIGGPGAGGVLSASAGGKGKRGSYSAGKSVTVPLKVAVRVPAQPPATGVVASVPSAMVTSCISTSKLPENVVPTGLARA